MKYISILALFVISLVACQPKSTHLSRAKFKNILMDMHLAESLSQNLPKDSLHMTIKNEDSLKVYNARILKHYLVTEKEFLATLNFYKSKPDQLDSIYQELLSDIAIIQSRVK